MTTVTAINSSTYSARSRSLEQKHRVSLKPLSSATNEPAIDENAANLIQDVAEEEEYEDEDDEEEECHLLIKDGKLHKVNEKTKPSSKTRAPSKRARDKSSPLTQAFQHWPQHQSKHGLDPTDNDHHHWQPTIRQPSSARPSLFRTLIGYLVGPREASSDKNGQPSSADDWCDDFVYSSQWPQQQQPLPNGQHKFHHDSDTNNHTGQWSLATFSRLFAGGRTARRRQPNRPQGHLIGANGSLCSFLCLGVVLVLILLIATILISYLIDISNKYSNPLDYEQSDSIDELLRRLEIDHQLNEASRLEYENEQSARWLVSSSKCHIPVLDPWHESIKGYVSVKKPMNCEQIIDKTMKDDPDLYNKTKSSKTMTFVNQNKIYLTQEAISKGALNNGNCCYRTITRGQENDEDLEYSDQCVAIMENGLQIVGQNVRLIEVNCKTLNYENVHSVLVNDEQEEKAALAQVAADKLDFDNYYNVLMVGMDTMSNLNGQRQLNKTLSLLEGLYKRLNFVGYNKVGENTFPNLIPLLTGLKSEQLTHIGCWLVSNYSDASETGNDFLDNCKYLWNFYQQVGYTTYFNEDWAAASTFNYLKPGFKHEPTTYYGRPFQVARKKHLFPQFHSSGCASCHLDLPIVGIDLDNLKTFLQMQNNKPYFAFHWINCPQHDDLNGASSVDFLLEKFFNDIHEITQNDRTFVFFFSDHGYRWNSFASTRIGHYEASLPLLTISPPKRFIKQHPDLYENMKQHQNVLLTPFDMFKTLIGIKNLGLKSENGTMKTTKRSPEPNSTEAPKPAPSNSTLKESTVAPSSVMNSSQTTWVYPTALTTIKQLTVQDGLTFKQQFRTLSLLDRHNSSDVDRSCLDAGIPDNYCVCHQFKKVSTDLEEVLGAAYYLVYVHLESKLSNHVQLCHQLELDRVYGAELHDLEPTKMNKTKTASRRRRDTANMTPVTSPYVIGANETSKPDSLTTAQPIDTIELTKLNALPNREYNIMFSTLPGRGLFQEVVRYYGDDLDKCRKAVRQAKTIINDSWASMKDKRSSVMAMNQICEFMVFSESISRLNLYKDQSKCVKSNIELKKICYCHERR